MILKDIDESHYRDNHRAVGSERFLIGGSYPLLRKAVDISQREIDKVIIEAAVSAGATPWMIIKDVLLAEARPGITQGITLTAISLIGFSAMAGIVGGGGIGDLAIRFGYYRYDNTVMLTTVIILICLVQLIQLFGDWISARLNKR